MNHGGHMSTGESKDKWQDGKEDDLSPASPVDTTVMDRELHPGWSPARPEHIPRPTYWPAALAFGITLFIWGLITTPLLSAPGLVLFAVALAGWIGEMRHERREQ